MKHYDQNGNLIGEDRPGWLGKTEHYDAAADAICSTGGNMKISNRYLDENQVNFLSDTFMEQFTDESMKEDF